MTKLTPLEKLDYKIEEESFTIIFYFKPENSVPSFYKEVLLCENKDVKIVGPKASLKKLYQYSIKFKSLTPKETMNEMFSYASNPTQLVVWMCSDDLVYRSFANLLIKCFKYEV